MPLTNTECKHFKPREKRYKKGDGGGLYMDVMPNGSKYWRLKYRLNGKEKLLALGVYPTISLADARERRDQAKKLLANGQDPSVVKQETKRLDAINAINTFEAIAREWFDKQKPRWTERYADYMLKRLENDIFPNIGNRPIKDITPPILLDTLRKIEKRGAHELARRMMQVSGQVFRYAIVTGRAERDPTADLKGALEAYKKAHYAAIDVGELPAFIETLERNDARLYIQTRLAIKFLMLTFVRTSEMINARWDEIDFKAKQWVIPAERMKMRRSHIVPLSNQAITILEQLKPISGTREHIFPSQFKPRISMSNNTVLKAIERLGYKGRMTGHGFRALAMSSIKEKLGYRHEVIDLQLAHAKRSKIDAAYDRAEFLDERRKMMQEWADYVDGLAIPFASAKTK